jgi:hypothetical protein
MEVARPRFRIAKVQSINYRSSQRHDIVLILKCAVEPQNLSPSDSDSVSLVHLTIARETPVSYSRRIKNDAASSAGALPRDHHTGDARVPIG